MILIPRQLLIITNRMSLQNIKTNAARIQDTMNSLKSELKVLTAEYNTLLSKQLTDENAKLVLAVEEARQRLIQLEIQNGVPQIPVPIRGSCTKANPPPVVQEQVQKPTKENVEIPKKVKETKPKKVKEAKEPIAELPIDIGRLDLRIGHIDQAERHPEADTLYLLKINCGDVKPRTVCSGLVNHVPIDKLKDRDVVVLCNLKPVKMRGIVSEAMVMCASCEKGVEVLLPPAGCAPGDFVECEGYTRNPDSVMNPKKKIFETVAPDLHTNEGLLACYKDKPLSVPGKGAIKAETLKNVPIK